MFLRCVPPSEPLIPLSARTPNTWLNSAVPPLTFRAVAPIVRIASPSCETLVFVVDDVFAISSTIFVVSSVLNPRAVCASVTMSEAMPKSIAPAAARFRTLGSIFIDVSVSYPASAI